MTSRLDGLSQIAAQAVAAAARALDAGRADEAGQHLASAVAAYPDHPEVLRMQAGLLGMRGQHQAAIACMRRGLTQRPDDAASYNTLGTLLGQAGEFDAAIEALRRTCQLQPDMALAWYNLGVMLTRSVRNEEAVSALQNAVAVAPDHVAARTLLGDLLRTRGQIADAATEYRKVIAQQPWSGMAWWGLADLKTTRFASGDIELMQAALKQSAASDDDLIAMGFALAKALDDSGRYADSLRALQEANNVARRRQAVP